VINKLLIEDHGIYLRSLLPMDVDQEYLNWLKNPLVNAHLEIRFDIPTGIEELQLFIKKMNECADTLFMGIFKKDGNKHIGNIKLGPINQYHRFAEVGFLIGDPAEWGKGYAARAIELISNYGFLQLGLVKLTAGCYENNYGSHRALLKAGFQEEGRETLKYEFNGIRQDGIRFGKLSPHYT